MGVGHALVLMASAMVMRMGVIMRMAMRMGVCAVLTSVIAAATGYTPGQ